MRLDAFNREREQQLPFLCAEHTASERLLLYVFICVCLNLYSDAATFSGAKKTPGLNGVTCNRPKPANYTILAKRVLFPLLLLKGN